MPSEELNRRRTVLGLYLTFGGLGATAAVIPAALPAVEQELGASVSAAVPALFGGLLLGVLGTGPLLHRLSAVNVAVVGCVLQAASLCGGALAADAASFVVFAVLAGVGFGLTEGSASVASKLVTASSTAAALTALTATVAVAAALTPLLVAVAVAVGGGSPDSVLLLVASAQLVAASVLIRGPVRPRGMAVRRAGGRRRPHRGDLVPLVPFAVALAFYVGVETVLAGWSAVIPAELLGVDASVAALGTSAFWGLMALGRGGAAVIVGKGFPPRRALVLGQAVAAVGLLGAAATAAAAPTIALALIATAVVVIAPTYGLVLGMALDRLDHDGAAAFTGLLVACGAAGGSAVPLVVLLWTGPAGSATFIVAAVLCAVVACCAGLFGEARRA